eukprot:TRINITY_DN8681_c0_g1_i2.p1 TRINITY_DN8681_c0_g1~~TRINITY_DN8681_c0_g1_i2.p1  ORF type:complete len:660 (+),score=227.83 TRINITY_DN8681_c0_g1_i2:158-2137(+)
MGQGSSIPGEEIAGYKEYEKLIYKNKQLETLPKAECDKLAATCKYFDASDNLLYKDLRNSLALVGKFMNLRHLLLHNNKLVRLPTDIWKVEYLETLDLGKNHLTRLPSDILNLSVLKRLSLSENKIDKPSLEFVGQIYSLVALDLVSVDVDEKSFPTDIFWNEMRFLDLSCNKFKTMPQSLCGLPRLQYLSLAENKIETLPEEFEKLTGLTMLDLSNNSLLELPTGIGRMAGMRKVDLNFNQLRQLPEEVSRLSALEAFTARFNKLMRFPLFMAESLVYLDLWSNMLSTVPPEIGRLRSLRVLVLCCNEITTVSKEISHCVNLKKIDLGFNLLPDIPDELAHIKTLEEVVLTDNPLPESFLPHLKSAVDTCAYLRVRAGLDPTKFERTPDGEHTSDGFDWDLGHLQYRRSADSRQELPPVDLKNSASGLAHSLSAEERQLYTLPPADGPVIEMPTRPSALSSPYSPPPDSAASYDSNGSAVSDVGGLPLINGDTPRVTALRDASATRSTLSPLSSAGGSARRSSFTTLEALQGRPQTPPVLVAASFSAPASPAGGVRPAPFDAAPIIHKAAGRTAAALKAPASSSNRRMSGTPTPSELMSLRKRATNSGDRSSRGPAEKSPRATRNAHTPRVSGTLPLVAGAADKPKVAPMHAKPAMRL